MKVLETPIDTYWKDRVHARLLGFAEEIYDQAVASWSDYLMYQWDAGTPSDADHSVEERAFETGQRIMRAATEFGSALCDRKLEALEAKRLAALRRIIAEAQQ